MRLHHNLFVSACERVLKAVQTELHTSYMKLFIFKAKERARVHSRQE